MHAEWSFRWLTNGHFNDQPPLPQSAPRTIIIPILLGPFIILIL
jgi:hypothetical protein